jgi:hypothetical protein
MTALKPNYDLITFGTLPPDVMRFMVEHTSPSFVNDVIPTPDDETPMFRHLYRTNTLSGHVLRPIVGKDGAGLGQLTKESGAVYIYHVREKDIDGNEESGFLIWATTVDTVNWTIELIEKQIRYFSSRNWKKIDAEKKLKN